VGGRIGRERHALCRQRGGYLSEATPASAAEFGGFGRADGEGGYVGGSEGARDVPGLLGSRIKPAGANSACR